MIWFKLFLATFCDVPERWQLDFQEGASPVMLGIVDLHHDLMFFLV
jgi:cytochrome c oxidase subunit 2